MITFCKNESIDSTMALVTDMMNASQHTLSAFSMSCLLAPCLSSTQTRLFVTMCMTALLRESVKMGISWAQHSGRAHNLVTFGGPIQAMLKGMAMLKDKAPASLDSLPEGSEVEARVELVKKDMNVLVVTLPRHGNTIAFVSAVGLNTQHSTTARTFGLGSCITAVVSKVPPWGERVLLHLPPSVMLPVAGQRKGQGAAAVGRVVTAVIKSVHAVHVDMQVGKQMGRMHVCELADIDPVQPAEVRLDPLIANVHVMVD